MYLPVIVMMVAGLVGGPIFLILGEWKRGFLAIALGAVAAYLFVSKPPTSSTSANSKNTPVVTVRPIDASPAPAPVGTQLSEASRGRLEQFAGSLSGLRATLGSAVSGDRQRAAYLDAYLPLRKAHQVMVDHFTGSEKECREVLAARAVMVEVEALASIYTRANEIAARIESRNSSKGRSKPTSAELLEGLRQASADDAAARQMSSESITRRLAILRTADSFNDAMRSGR